MNSGASVQGYSIFYGDLPLCINIDAGETSSLSAPYPLYVNASRLCYLPQLLNRYHLYFYRYLYASPNAPLQVWFDWDGIPLDWRLPVGILFDLFTGESTPLPWNLTIHFYSNPIIPSNYELSILPYLGWKSFQSMLQNEFKLALLACNESVEQWKQLKKQQEEEVWNALKEVDVRKFFQVAKTALAKKAAKKLPIRLHIWGPPYRKAFIVADMCRRKKGESAQKENGGDISSEEDNRRNESRENESPKNEGEHDTSGTEPDKIEAVAGDEGAGSIVNSNDEKTVEEDETEEEEVLLGDALHGVFPQMFPLCKLEGHHTGEELPDVDGMIEIDGKWGKRAKVLIHGIEAPLSAPLCYYGAMACQLDHCLHVVIRAASCSIISKENVRVKAEEIVDEKR